MGEHRNLVVNISVIGLQPCNFIRGLRPSLSLVVEAAYLFLCHMRPRGKDLPTRGGLF